MLIQNKLSIFIAAVLFASTVNGTIITAIEDATNSGGFFAEVTFTNYGANTVRVTADISDPINLGLSKGDILGLWFDLSDFSLLSGSLGFGGATTVLDSEYGENSVGSSLGGNVNMNGSGAINWDLAVNVGTNGSQGGFIQTLSFDITALGLDETIFAGQRVGMRVQSIEGSNFSAGSSKLLGTTVIEVPEPTTLLLYVMALLGIALRASKCLVDKNSI
ncbi:MAG: hypothetical protein JKY14_02230 [Paraglaciecola sp.]|nr:hypothetical protein [Paraglaciecola sp.]